MEKALPEAFVARIKSQFNDSEKFIKAISDVPYYSIRLNRQKMSDIGIEHSSPVSWCPNAYYINNRPNYTLNPKFHAGVFYPQEASSMYLNHVLSTIKPLLPTDFVALDLCAAPGGKSTLLASFMQNRGVLVANEIVRNRAWILRENIAKWGCTNAIVTNTDASAFGRGGAMFDLILIDAPCSGEGMFRKDDTAIAEWSLENAQMCAERQRQIFSDIWDSAVEGGIIIYSTCTFNPAENEENMHWIAQEFDVEFLKIPIVENSGVVAVNFSEGEGYGFYPNHVRGEGFFICAMRKLSGRDKRLSKDKSKIAKTSVPQDLLNDASTFEYYSINNKAIAFPRNVSHIMLQIAQNYHSIMCGIEIGEQTRKEFMPSTELALSQSFNAQSFKHTNINLDNALHYLRGEWTCENPQTTGWNVVMFDNTPLGFIKSIGNRVNNYYPKEWRIRMQV